MTQHTNFAGLNVLQNSGGACGQCVNLTAQHGHHGRACTRERNVGQLDASGLRQNFHGNVHGAVVTRRAIVDSTRTFARIFNKLFNSLPRRVSAHGQHRWVCGVTRNGAQLVQQEHGVAA